MPYGKIDWSTWTKAAMAQTIDTLMARQTELLNRIAELERAQGDLEKVKRIMREPEPACMTHTITIAEMPLAANMVERGVDWSKL